MPSTRDPEADFPADVPDPIELDDSDEPVTEPNEEEENEDAEENGDNDDN